MSGFDLRFQDGYDAGHDAATREADALLAEAEARIEKIESLIATGKQNGWCVCDEIAVALKEGK
jgi:hypothetical protein